MICIVASNSRIIATGGASANKAMLQVLSDVFNAPVYTAVNISITLIIYWYKTI